MKEGERRRRQECMCVPIPCFSPPNALISQEAKAGSQELNPILPCVWQGTQSSEPSVLPPRSLSPGSWNQEPEPCTEPSHFNVGCRQPNQWLNELSQTPSSKKIFNDKIITELLLFKRILNTKTMFISQKDPADIVRSQTLKVKEKY